MVDAEAAAAGAGVEAAGAGDEASDEGAGDEAAGAGDEAAAAGPGKLAKSSLKTIAEPSSAMDSLTKSVHTRLKYKHNTKWQHVITT